MGASSEPAVVIFLYLYLHPWYTFAAQACFGECFQWGYWTRMRNVEGCSAAPGVRVSHAPLSPSTCFVGAPQFVLHCFCVSHACPETGITKGGSSEPPLLFVRETIGRDPLALRLGRVPSARSISGRRFLVSLFILYCACYRFDDTRMGRSACATTTYFPAL